MRQIAARKATRKAIYKPLVDLPPLSPEDYAGLRASIAVSGVVVPIIVWPHRGVHYVVDGSYRRTIARGLGYECPEIVRSDLTEEEARIMARALNLARRQLEYSRKTSDHRRSASGNAGKVSTLGRKNARCRSTRPFISVRD